jgi:hypothetical protein
MGGDIIAQSAIGQGSCFIVTLPAFNQNALGPSAEADSAQNTDRTSPLLSGMPIAA